MTVERNPWIPHVPNDKQAAFLVAPEREAMYGGAAGGGKTDALLMGALQYVEQPGYAALILMRTFADLELPKSGISRAWEWLGGSAARPYNGGKMWEFPSGATLTFGYLSDRGSEQRYRTAEFQYVAFDELTRFDLDQYLFMFSRQRRLAGSRVPVRTRAATNPGDRGHEWVLKRFIADEFLKADKETQFSRVWTKGGRLFVPARLEDNAAHLDVADYVLSLSNMPEVIRAQLMHGDWLSAPGGRFHAKWWKRYGWHGTDYLMGDRIVPSRECPRFGTCDPAASSAETAKTADPDYTVVSAWARTPRHELIWLDCARFRREIPDIVPEIQRVYDRWGLDYVAIEAVAANCAVYQLAKRTRMAVKEVSPMGLDKLVRATKAIVLAESGRLWLPEAAPWLEEAEAELLRFTGDDKQDAHDDIVDTVSYAAQLLTTQSIGHRGFRPYVAGGTGV